MCINKDILATLAYFNLFSYPLQKKEILMFLRRRANHAQLSHALDMLTGESQIFRIDEYYCLQNNPALVDRRCKGARKAGLLLRQAGRGGAILSSFPFVKGVAVSGSLSKNFADETSDIDFFIITSAGRLWIARTLLHIFKKITYLFNRQHAFCMNYFIDESHLAIMEKNLYTATEVATVMPLRGAEVFEKFYAANAWTRRFFPNHCLRISCAKDIRRSRFRTLVEKMFDNPIGDQLESLLMRLTAASWARKTRRHKKTGKGFTMSLDVAKYFAKPDPRNFQQNLLRRYEESLGELLSRHGFASRARNG